MRGLKGVRMKEQEGKMNREEDGSFGGLRALFGVDISSWL